MPITNQPNLAALQAAIVQAITDSQTAVIANSDSNAAAVVTHVTDETGAAATALAGEIATKATETQAAVDAAATATQGAITAKGSIKSIQRGTISITSNTTDVAIAEINTAKAIVVFAGLDTYFTSGTGAVKGELTAGTNLRLTATRSSAGNTSVTWQVIEYE